MALQNIELLHTDDIEVCIDQQIFFNPREYSGGQLYTFSFQIDNIGFTPQPDTGFILTERTQICPVITPTNSIPWLMGESFEDFLIKVRQIIYDQVSPDGGNVVRNDNIFTVIAEESFLPSGVTEIDCNNIFKMKACMNGNIVVTINEQPRCIDDPNFFKSDQEVQYGFPHVYNCVDTQDIEFRFKEPHNSDNFYLFTVTEELLAQSEGNPDVFADCNNVAGVGAVIKKHQSLTAELEYDPEWTLQYTPGVTPPPEGDDWDCGCAAEETLKGVQDVTFEALNINLAFTSDIESEFTRTLQIVDQNDGHIIAEIGLYGQTIEEDERLKVMLQNFGQEVAPDESYIFRESDVFEGKPDFEILNTKRKELLLEYHNIFPYLGSYRGLLNIIRWYGYNDSLRLIELWRNVDMADENYGKFLRDQVRLFEPFNFQQKKELLPNKKYKKTNKFALAYDLNRLTGELDQVGLPIVEDAFEFTNEEILIKLFGLREKLRAQYLPLNADITEITGEGMYFHRYAIATWTDEQQVFRIENQVTPKFDFFRDYGYVQDLRPILNASNVINVQPNINGEIDADAFRQFNFDVNAGDKYSFRVRAIYGDGNNRKLSSWSGFYLSDDYATTTTPPAQALRVDVTKTRPPNDSDDGYQLTLNWDGVDDALVYQVQFRKSTSDNFIDAYDGASGTTPTAVTSTEFVFIANPVDTYTTLAPTEAIEYAIKAGVSYEFRVRPVFASGTGAWTYTEFNSITYCNQCRAPYDITINQGGGDFVVIEWAKPGNNQGIDYVIQSYEIEYRNYDVSVDVNGTPTANPVPFDLVYPVDTNRFGSNQRIKGLPVFDVPLSIFGDDLVGFFENYALDSIEFEDKKNIPAGFPLIMNNRSFEVTWDEATFTWDSVGVYLKPNAQPFDDLTEEVGNFRDGFYTSESFIDDDDGITNRFKIFLETPPPVGAPPFVLAPYPTPVDDLPDGAWQETFVSDMTDPTFVAGKDNTVLKIVVGQQTQYLRLISKSFSPVVDPPELDYLVLSGDIDAGGAYHEFLFEEINQTAINFEDYPDVGSLIEVYESLPQSPFYTWENLGAGNYIEMEWIVEKTLPEEADKNFRYQIRGSVSELQSMMVFLPYTGQYTVTLNLYDGSGAKNGRIAQNIITVNPQQPDFVVFSRYMRPSLQVWESNDLSWEDIDSDWDSIIHEQTGTNFVQSGLSPRSLRAQEYIFANSIDNPPELWGVDQEWDFFENSSWERMNNTTWDYLELKGERLGGFRVNRVAPNGTIQVGDNEPFVIPARYYYDDYGKVVPLEDGEPIPNDRPVFDTQPNDFTAVANLINENQFVGVSDYYWQPRPIAEPPQNSNPTYMTAVQKNFGSNFTEIVGFDRGVIGDIDVDLLKWETNNYTWDDIEINWNHIEQAAIADAQDNSFNLSELKVFDNGFDIPVNVPVYIVDDNSKIPGKQNQIWRLYDEEQDGELIAEVSGVPYFVYTFAREGLYSLEVGIFDTNLNFNATTKSSWINVVSPLS